MANNTDNYHISDSGDYVSIRNPLTDTIIDELIPKIAEIVGNFDNEYRPFMIIDMKSIYSFIILNNLKDNDNINKEYSLIIICMNRVVFDSAYQKPTDSETLFKACEKAKLNSTPIKFDLELILQLFKVLQ